MKIEPGRVLNLSESGNVRMIILDDGEEILKVYDPREDRNIRLNREAVMQSESSTEKWNTNLIEEELGSKAAIIANECFRGEYDETWS